MLVFLDKTNTFCLVGKISNLNAYNVLYILQLLKDSLPIIYMIIIIDNVSGFVIVLLLL